MNKKIIGAVLALTISSLANAQDVTIKIGSGGLKAADKEKEVKFQVGGRLMWDYNNAAENGVTDESDLAVRRARLFVKTQIGDWTLKSQFNVAEEATVDTSGDDARTDSGGTVEDLYIQYSGFGKQAKVTLGRQKTEFGLEELTSSKDITFLERNAATEAYVLGRKEGIQIQGDINTFHYGIGAFERGEGSQEAGKIAIVARAAYALKTDTALFHTGLAYATGGDTDQLGLELAAVAGPLHAQAEFMQQDTDGADKEDAFYAQVGYVLTGETRPYKSGKFKRIKPSASTGAYEVVVRYTDGEANYSDTELGDTDGSEYGIGLNYYANNNVRLGVTYSESESADGTADGEELRARAQLVF